MSFDGEYYCTNCGAILNDQWGFDPDKGYWVCTKCGQMMMADDVYAGTKFEGVTWICDRCGALLNRQLGFNDSCGEWKCTECGCANGITNNDIIKHKCPKCYNPLDIQPGYVDGLVNYKCFKCNTNLKYDYIHKKYVEDISDDLDDKKDEENNSEDNNHSYGDGSFAFNYDDYKEYKERLATENNRKEGLFKRLIKTTRNVVEFLTVPLVFVLLFGGICFIASKIAGWLGGPEKLEDHPGEIKLEYAASYYIGKNYYDTIIMLQEQGLSDISITPLNDLKTGIFSKDGKIETIEIDGISDFNADTWVSEDSVVNISYHSIIKKDKNGFIEEKNSHLILGGVDIQIPNYLIEDSKDSKRAIYHVKDDEKTQLIILLDDNDFYKEINEFDNSFLLLQEECKASTLIGEELIYLGKKKDTVFNIHIVTLETKPKSEYIHFIFTTPDDSKKDYESDYRAIVSGIYIPKNTEIRIDFYPEDFKGKNYEDVVAELKKKGFDNIQVNNLEDVVIGVFTKEGVVESITINGREDFKVGDWIDNQAEILITYHGK